jgi:hypothetical protein
VGSNKNESAAPPELYIRHAGQFIMWAVITLVGWSFYHTMKHETEIAVMEQRVSALEAHVRAGLPK